MLMRVLETEEPAETGLEETAAKRTAVGIIVGYIYLWIAKSGFRFVI